MLSWLKRFTEPAAQQRGQILHDTVSAALADGDEVHARIVASAAALCLCVAYADLKYDREEEKIVRGTLERVHGLDPAGVDAILLVLREHTVDIARAEATTYARELLELTDEEFREELLDVLVDLAAADEEIAVTETNMLRTIARALGLSQQQYNASQARHREKLAVLKQRD